MLALYAAALFVMWIVTFPSYDPARHNGLTYGVITGTGALLLGFYYWRQELASRKARAPVPATSSPS